MSRKLKVLDLFAGIGGFALGLDSTGFFETVKFVEMDKYCQKVLRKNFPNIPIEEDIKNVKGKEYEADVITGGFPCQPFSVAGKQKGTNDDRYLWPEMLRLIREIKPEFIIGENVQGIINLQNGVVLRQVQDDLESEGFEVQCFLIPASGIGAWHQRYRVWIVAHSNSNRNRHEIRGSNGEKKKIQREYREKDNSTWKFIRTDTNEDVPNTYGTGSFEKHSASVNREIKRDGSINESSSRRDKETKKDVSNTNNTRSRASKHGIEREGQKTDKGWKEQSQSESSRHNEDVSNTTSKRLEREFGKKLQGSRVRSTNSSKDVSNTDSGMRRGWRTIGESGENKVWRFYSEEEDQTRLDIRSETIGRDAVSGEEANALQSDDERREERNVSNQSEEQDISSGGHDTDGQEQTWWQIESNIRGVPNGISYELDKNRSNRIKTLGNAIVPQIARELGLAIKKVMNEDTDI